MRAPTVREGIGSRKDLLKSLEEIYWKSVERPQSSAGRATSQVIAFRLGEETYGVDIQHTQGITRFPRLVHIPGAGEPFLGAMTFRGRVVPVASLSSILGLPRTAAGKETRAIVAGRNEDLVGLAVDEVIGILEIDLEEVQAPPAGLSGRAKGMIRGQVKKDDRLIILADIGAMMESLCVSNEEVTRDT